MEKSEAKRISHEQGGEKNATRVNFQRNGLSTNAINAIL